MSLKARGLNCRYGPIVALESVDLEIGPGEAVVICGKNGSGKSTLLRCLAGLQKPSRGQVTIDGTPAGKARRRIGLTIQYPERALFGRTLYDDLAFAPRNAGLAPAETDERVRRAIELAGVPRDLLSAHHRRLSQGQKRLAGIASVLSGSPAYLFLDEPTAGLDYPGRRRVLELIRHLAGSGTAVVAASHDPLAFAGTCSRVIVLEAGRVSGDGALDEADLGPVGIRSATLDLSRGLRRRGWPVPETYSPELLADCIAEVVGDESAAPR